jgi:long-chain-fatty-acid--[acyl-carrier-protein] ligase
MIVFRWIFWTILRLFVRARYRIRVHGKEQLKGLKGPVLILPNHPGYIDPFLLFSTFWPALRMRPLVFSGTFQGPTGRFLVSLVNALEIPDIGVASVRAREQAEGALEGVVAGLRRGERFAVWPAGRVWRDGVERIGPARAAADLLRQAPEATVLLVRSRGVWGSSWTWAQLSARPPMIRCMLAGMGWVFANLFFFMPRRHVDMTLEVVDRARLPELRPEVLNRWLEQWYNGDLPGPEKPTWVPYHFLFGRRTFEFPPPPRPLEVSFAEVKPETRAGVLELLEACLQRPIGEAEGQPATRLEDLGLDSLKRADLSLDVERRFGFTGDGGCETVGQLYALAEGRLPRRPPKPPPPEWSQARVEDGPPTLRGDTLTVAFVEHALKHPRDVVVADDTAGALTGEQLLVGALTLARRLRRIEEENVGVLLPASAACDVALLALYLAGKLPVLLNWTTGPANLAHAVQTARLGHVITSGRFLDRLGIPLDGVQVLKVEDLYQKKLDEGQTRTLKWVSRWEQLRTLLMVRWLPGLIRGRLPRSSPDRPAVVLFTSGSEKAPKAVPLTHANILSCQRGGLSVMGLKRNDVVLGFLPAFHSFGLTVTGLMPLLTGIRVVRHPDPTDAGNLVHKIAAYGVTTLVGTPTFVNYILERAKPGDLDPLRLIVVGAEKCPPALVERCGELAPGAVVLEGYGITECAPVVAVNPPEAPRLGSVGRPLPAVEVRAVDLDTGAALPTGQMGMLHVSGPTVFPGYLNHDGPSPFVEADGRRWYVTGDLGEIDVEGYIWFRGRLKRFLKAGGEMISLPALEGPFARMYPPTQEGPRVAVEGVEHEGGRRIVLFTTEDLTLRDANALLVKEGFHGVMRLDEVRKVDAIPLLGTGKIDYKQLRALVLDSLAPR